MDLRQLTALVTVAEVGSVTKAAARLQIVQPAVTRQIRLLETELGHQLFERSRHGMTLTAEGRVLVEYAKRALREIDHAKEELRRDASPESIAGGVSVGLLESTLAMVAGPLATTVRRRFPGVELRVVTAYSGHLQEWLEAGDLDLSLLYNMSPVPSLQIVPLLEEQLWVVGPPSAELDPEDPPLWEQICGRPLVLPTRGHGLRTMFDREVPAGLSARPAIETNSMLLQKEFVRAGFGWTILPAGGVALDIEAGELTGAPLAQPEVLRKLVLGLPRTSQTPPQVEAVATALIHVVSRLVRSGGWPAARPLDWKDVPT